MKLLNTDSLAATVDAVNEAFFLGKKIPSNQRDAVAAWIAARQGIKGSYAGMFAPRDRISARAYSPSPASGSRRGPAWPTCWAKRPAAH